MAILYGLYVMNFGESSDPRVLVELAHDAEQGGWKSNYIKDCRIETNFHPDRGTGLLSSITVG